MKFNEKFKDFSEEIGDYGKRPFEMYNHLETLTALEYDTKYKKPDVLIVEDIECLKGRGTGTELFYLVLPELIDNNRQVIFTAEKPRLQS